MAEDDTKVDHTEAAIAKFNEALSSHKQLTESELGKLKQEALDAIAESGRASAQEINTLKEQLKEITDWRADVQKAREERDKVKSSSSTMVVPPNDVKPTVPDAPPPEGNAPGEQSKTSWWKKVW